MQVSREGQGDVGRWGGAAVDEVVEQRLDQGVQGEVMGPAEGLVEPCRQRNEGGAGGGAVGPALAERKATER